VLSSGNNSCFMLRKLPIYYRQWVSIFAGGVTAFKLLTVERDVFKQKFIH
jgi:hypothetical protein